MDNLSQGDLNYERLVELERFAEIGRLSAGLLHEISNPLASAILWLEQYDNRHSPAIRHVRSSIRVLQRYVEAARQQVRRESRYRHFRVQPQINQVRRVIEPIARRHGVRLRFAPAVGLSLYGDPVKFQQILANLICNAIEAYGHSVGIRDIQAVSVDFRSSQRWLIIEVRDHGCGITAEQLAQLFKPFYSTKAGQGLGLGIGLFAIKSHIEADFGGRIQAQSSPRGGTRFIVRLPLSSSGPANSGYRIPAP